MIRLKSIAALTLAVLMTFAAVSSGGTQIPIQAPLVPQEVQASPPGCGFVPPPFDLHHLTGTKEPDPLRMIQAPSQWDWREQGNVTSVKNQGPCGSCYAFASVANIESKMLLDGEGTFDFSENSVKECNWYQTSCGGGNYELVADFLSKNGVVLESCDPYVPSNVSCNSACSYVKNLIDWRIICWDNVPTTAILQDYIYAYGPVYTTVYAGDAGDAAWEAEFGSYDGSYTLYYSEAGHITNHAVLIVGWDDDFVHAGGTGGWIVKNSWGTGWGGPCGYGAEGGYFTIAYGSAGIGQYSSFIHGWQNHVADGQILYYDDAGYSSSWGYANTTVWGLCKFVPSTDVYLDRVEFWTNDATTDVDVYVYDDFNGSTVSNLLTAEYDVSFDEAGYHSVALEPAPEISSGNDIYAVLKITNATYGYPLVTDYLGLIESNKTYMSPTGNSGTWIEMGTGYGNDVAIRVRTSPSLAVSADDLDETVPEDSELSHNYPNPFNPATTITYTLDERSNVNISIYNMLGQKVITLVDGVESAGEHSVRWEGTGSDGVHAPTGVYFYRIEAGQFTETRKMLLLR